MPVVDTSAFVLPPPRGVDDDPLAGYKYEPEGSSPVSIARRSGLLTAEAGLLSALIAKNHPLSRGVVNSPLAMGVQGAMLAASVQGGDPEQQRATADVLLAARAASLAESLHVGVREANAQLAAASAAMRSSGPLRLFGAQNVAQYRATISALTSALLKEPARNLGALIAVGVARSLLTDPQ